MLSAPLPAATTFATEGRSLWRLASIQQDGETLVVGGAYDGRVSAWGLDGARRWEAPGEAFVFDLAAGDVDGDGADEVAVAGADGVVKLVGAQGRVLWQQQMNSPVYQVAILPGADGARVVAAGSSGGQFRLWNAAGEEVFARDYVGAVRFLRPGDFDGDGQLELALGVITRSPPWTPGLLHILEPEGWQSWWEEPEAFMQSHAGFNGAVGDLNGDGRDDLSLNELIVHFGPGRTLTRHAYHGTGLPGPTYDFRYRTTWTAIGDFLDRPGREVAALMGPDLVFYDAQGKVLESVRAARSMADLLVLPGNGGDRLVLGPSPSGDDRLLILDPRSADWKAALRDDAPGPRLAAIEATNNALRAQADAWEGTPAYGQAGPYPVQVASTFQQDPAQMEENLAATIRNVRYFSERFPSQNLRLGTVIWVSENMDFKRPGGQPWGRDKRLHYAYSHADLVRMASILEAEKTWFWVQVGHGAAPYISLESIEAILKTAPTYCLGFVSAEDPVEMVDYYTHFLQPAMELCLRYGNRMFIVRSKWVYWAVAPTVPHVRETILQPRYRGILVPGVEDSNSRTTDVNMASRMGLWLNGSVDRWCSRMVADCFSFNRAWSWEHPMTGHPHLRYLTSHAMMGASVFMIKVGELEQVDGQPQATRVGRQGVETFLRLLDGGLLAPPRREQLGNLSPVVVQMPRVSERFAATGLNGHNFETFAHELESEYVFARQSASWGMSPVAPQDLSRLFWGRERLFGNFIPRSEFGYVALLPGESPAAATTGLWSEGWNSDGDQLQIDGRPVNSEEAQAALAAAWEAAQAEAPFRLSGPVFSQWSDQGGGRHLVVLSDPRYVDPLPATVWLTPQAPGGLRVRDRLTGELLHEGTETVSVTVPAGSLRLLDVEVLPQP